MKKFILLLSILIVFAGCFKNYFSVKSVSIITEEDWNKIIEPGKTLILHTPEKNVELVDLKINRDIIEATILPHYPIKPGYTNPDPSRKKHPYKMKDKAYLMEQVHIYSKAELPENSLRVSLQKEEVAKLSSYTPAKTATIINHTASVLLVSAAIFAIGVGIAAASMNISPW